MTKAQLDQLEFEASRDPRHVPPQVYSHISHTCHGDFLCVARVFTRNLCVACSLADCDCVSTDKPTWGTATLKDSAQSVSHRVSQALQGSRVSR